MKNGLKKNMQCDQNFYVSVLSRYSTLDKIPQKIINQTLQCMIPLKTELLQLCQDIIVYVKCIIENNLHPIVNLLLVEDLSNCTTAHPSIKTNMLNL